MSKPNFSKKSFLLSKNCKYSFYIFNRVCKIATSKFQQAYTTVQHSSSPSTRSSSNCSTIISPVRLFVYFLTDYCTCDCVSEFCHHLCALALLGVQSAPACQSSLAVSLPHARGAFIHLFMLSCSCCCCSVSVICRGIIC